MIDTIAHFRYAELFQQKGDLPKARENLHQASALFHEIDMPWWLEQADALGARIEHALPGDKDE